MFTENPLAVTMCVRVRRPLHRLLLANPQYWSYVCHILKLA